MAATNYGVERTPPPHFVRQAMPERMPEVTRPFSGSYSKPPSVPVGLAPEVTRTFTQTGGKTR